MEPRDKAIELMDKYWELDVDDRATVWTEKCKQCCLIAVNEIIDSLQIKNYAQAYNYEYWNEVKQEIENL